MLTYTSMRARRERCGQLWIGLRADADDAGRVRKSARLPRMNESKLFAYAQHIHTASAEYVVETPPPYYSCGNNQSPTHDIALYLSATSVLNSGHEPRHAQTHSAQRNERSGSAQERHHAAVRRAR